MGYDLLIILLEIQHSQRKRIEYKDRIALRCSGNRSEIIISEWKLMEENSSFAAAKAPLVKIGKIERNCLLFCSFHQWSDSKTVSLTSASILERISISHYRQSSERVESVLCLFVESKVRCIICDLANIWLFCTIHRWQVRRLWRNMWQYDHICKWVAENAQG